MPFGVDEAAVTSAIENAGSASESAGAPEGASPTGQVSEAQRPEQASGDNGEAARAAKPPSLVDLDKLERFRFNGREWNPKDLRNAQLRHEDYTRKTQEVAEARKFADNFVYDLQTVLRDRSKLEEFQRIYPKEYVQIAQGILSSLPSQPQAVTPTAKSALDPAMAERLSRMENQFTTLMQQTEKAQVEQIQSWLDNQFDVLGRKYPFADPEVIDARAELAARNGTQITADVLEKLFKQHDEQMKERKSSWDKAVKEKQNQQIQAGKKAKDMGTGGGTPGGAPKAARTIKDATKLALKDLAGIEG